MPGYLPERDLVRLVAGAAALVFSSRYEGFGLPPLQALACGTPVVASDLPALREVLGEQADLVPVGDPDGLAEALGRVLTDEAHRDRLVVRGHVVAAGYQWSATADALVDLCNRAVKDHVS
jgi:glycosyltransferase involved in cell wall biosynthesis